MSLGPLVVSLVPRTFESLGRALEGGAAAGADLVELRLDHLAGEVRRVERKPVQQDVTLLCGLESGSRLAAEQRVHEQGGAV